jgi:hypothetical protein
MIYKIACRRERKERKEKLRGIKPEKSLRSSRLCGKKY